MKGRSPGLGLAASLANLLLLRVWFDVLATPADAAFVMRLPGRPEAAAALANWLALTFAGWGVLRWAVRWPKWLRFAAILFGLALILHNFRSVLSTYVPPFAGRWRVLWLSVSRQGIIAGLAVAVLLVFLAAFWRWFESFVLALAALGKFALPVVVVTCGGALWKLVSPPAIPVEPATAARLQPRPAGTLRVVWILFDEWDYRLAFEQRPPGASLPALDQLAAHSLVLSNAIAADGKIPVERMSTATAVPALLGTSRDLREPSLFHRLRLNEGANIGIAGWYLPYCRAFASDVVDCYWDQIYRQATAVEAPVARIAVWQLRSLFETGAYSLFGRSISAERHAAEYQAILHRARRMVADRALDLVFLHFNIPHAPFVYDAKTGSFAGRRQGFVSGYADALVLVDRTVADLLPRLEPQRTVLILSSDHPMRSSVRLDGKADSRVPLLVHFPGQTDGAVCEREISARVAGPLVQNIIGGRVVTAADAERFLRDWRN